MSSGESWDSLERDKGRWAACSSVQELREKGMMAAGVHRRQTKELVYTETASRAFSGQRDEGNRRRMSQELPKQE